MRLIFALSVLFSGLASAGEIARPSYAEIQVGLATSLAYTTFRDVESDRVAPGSLGTTLMFSGYFPLYNSFILSPTFALLSTDGEVSDDPSHPSVFDIRFHQREFGADALICPGDLSRLMAGLGASLAWWTAAEDNARVSGDPDDPVYERGRTIEGKSLMARSVLHLALRNPQVSGASIKFVAAWPLAELLRLNNTAATGYVGLQCGFSMILN